MKKILFIFIALFLMLPIFAQEDTGTAETTDVTEATSETEITDVTETTSAVGIVGTTETTTDVVGTTSATSEDKTINPKTGFPAIVDKPFVMFNEGASYAFVSRVQKQEGRSNFVWQDQLIGAFFEVQSQNMKPVNSIIRATAYYPFYHTYNEMRQYPKQTVLYAFDLFAGPIIEADMWKYVRLKFAGGLHYMYQLTDEYHLNYLGAGLLAGLELPVAPRWTILLDGNFNLDYPNFGTNKNVQPYDYSWQYHLDLGVRYSKKGENPYSYIRKTAMQTARWNAINARKEANRQARIEERAKRKAEKQEAYRQAHPEKVAAKEERLAKKEAKKQEKEAAIEAKFKAAEELVAQKDAMKAEKAKTKAAIREEKAKLKAEEQEAKRLLREQEKAEKAKAKAEEANLSEDEKKALAEERARIKAEEKEARAKAKAKEKEARAKAKAEEKAAKRLLREQQKAEKASNNE